MPVSNLPNADWNEIAATVADALDCASEAERLALITARCTGRPAMQAEVLSLLGHAIDAKQFIASGGALQHANVSTSKILKTFADGGAPDIGSRLNAWKILGELGRGGMGIVFHVEREISAPTGVSAQLQTRQQGALKLMRVDASNAQALARFAREQKILAQLNHPNIARLIDGGAAPDGNPYLVMEYAAGRNLDAWCATMQPTLPARIAVMQKICAAVQYAHQLLVVHRDLKPSNIVIEADGNPKLLDFGIAKLLSDADTNDHTAEAARVYTPWYASPEHLRGEVVSTASDVYSLGVILYGLLTAKRPYKLRNTTSATAVDVMHAVLETDATRPSSASSNTDIEAAWSGTDNISASFATALEGDLDTIILKALTKDPTQRYATPEALAADLQRFLNHEPISAASPSTWYRAKKFVRRNRVGVGASAVAASALFLGAGVAIWQGREAVKQRNIAELRLEESRKQATTVLFDYLGGVQYLAGSMPLRKRMAADMQRYLDKLNATAEEGTTANIPLLINTATALHRLSFVQYNGFFRPHLGEKDEAMANVKRALAIYAEVLATGAESEELRFEYGQALTQMGGLLHESKDLEGALSYFERSIPHYAVGATRDRADQRNAIELARIHLRITNALIRSTPYPNAAVDKRLTHHLQHARNTLNAITKKQPDQADAPHVWEWVLRLEIEQMGAKADWAGTLAPSAAKLAIMKELLAKEPSNTAYLSDIGATYRQLSHAHNELGNYAKALEVSEAGLAVTRMVLKNEADDRMSAPRHARVLVQHLAALTGLLSQGHTGQTPLILAALTETKSVIADSLKRDPSYNAAKNLAIETSICEVKFISLSNPTAALAIAQGALVDAVALDSPTEFNIGAALNVAQLQNQISMLARRTKNMALADASDLKLERTVTRITAPGVVPPPLVKIIARLQKAV